MIEEAPEGVSPLYDLSATDLIAGFRARQFSPSEVLDDVLAHIAYALPPLTREERAARAKVALDGQFNAKQRTFLEFVLAHYVEAGVEELDREKLTPLLKLKYHDSISDAVADLGAAEQISGAFAGFQKYLYQEGVGPSAP